MTDNTQFGDNVPVASPEVVVKKARKPKSLMPKDRKDEHAQARDLLAAYFKANEAVCADWTGLFPDRQLRVLANLLLDYIPGFLAAFKEGPSPEFLAQCRNLLASAASDVDYRKKHKTFFQLTKKQQASASD